jgi:hypothetical protein
VVVVAPVMMAGRGMVMPRPVSALAGPLFAGSAGRAAGRRRLGRRMAPGQRVRHRAADAHGRRDGHRSDPPGGPPRARENLVAAADGVAGWQWHERKAPSREGGPAAGARCRSSLPGAMLGSGSGNVQNR